MKVFIEAERGSREKGMYDEQSRRRTGTRRAVLPYPYPYGFVVGTRTDDGDAVDCYVITASALAEGTLVTCDPVALLEFFEEDEIDHKVLAVLPAEEITIDTRLRDELSDFIYGLFTAYPDMHVRVGRLLPKQAAKDHIQAFSAPG